MPLDPGSRVGEYEIVGPLGRGGQSEVYRARDLKLGREVAVKVLPRQLSREADKRARFEREAQLLAALNHRGIAVIHGIESSGELSYLVLELIEGETLADRIKRAPLSLADARDIFLQIAEALEAAHGRGIIHRDLKPANIKLPPGGAVKLLDFGLGKELRADAPAEPTTETFDGLETMPGLVMGTPGYMSPEQTRGRVTNERTDVWSFGVCLFEALSGTHPFARETIPDILSAILTEAPPWDELPRGLPPAWRTLLERTLRKDARRRLHDIGDVRIELEDAPTELEIAHARGGSGAVTIPRWVAAAVVGGLVAALGWIAFAPGSRGVRDREAVVRRFTIELPATAPVSLDGASALALSRDGRRLVYTARRGDRTQLYLRALDQLDAVPVSRAPRERRHRSSRPPGDDLGFFRDGSLSRVPVTGGSPIPLAPTESARGAVWSIDGDIVFSPLSRGGLSQISEDGGGAREITASPEEASEPAHRWPQLLPGGRHALTTLWTRASNDVAVVEIATGATEVLAADAAFGRYLPSGHLVFVREG